MSLCIREYFLVFNFKLLPTIHVPKLEKRTPVDARKSEDGEKLFMFSIYRCLKCHHRGSELIIIYNHTTFVISASWSSTKIWKDWVYKQIGQNLSHVSHVPVCDTYACMNLSVAAEMNEVRFVVKLTQLLLNFFY